MSEFKQPDEKEFEQVKQLVEDFWLDNENMKSEQFRVLTDNEKVIAFGRLKKHSDAIELCTLGVVSDLRGKGYGRAMVKNLLNKASRDIYVVTVIPNFFAKLGFIFAEIYPDSLQKKVELCTTHYHVGEPYQVMKWEKK